MESYIIKCTCPNCGMPIQIEVSKSIYDDYVKNDSWMDDQMKSIRDNLSFCNDILNNTYGK